MSLVHVRRPVPIIADRLSQCVAASGRLASGSQARGVLRLRGITSPTRTAT
jgi:hypothetical protein